MKKQFFSLALFAAAWLSGGSVMAHDGDHSYTNGICTIEGCTDKYQAPALVDSWYELINAGNVEWIGDYVKNTAVDPKVKMMNDIDFTGITHTPIGPDAQHKFNGVFDGQGYRIKNLTLSLEESGSNVGFFLWVRGGSTIKNLTFDRTCSFSAKDRAAAFICVLQANSSYPVTIENCVNYANVSSGAKVASGFVAACNWQNDDQPAVNFTNCVNAGTISSESDKTAAFFGWNKSSNVCTFTNCINIGSLTKIDGTHNLARGNNYDKLSFVNCYDLVNTTAQGKTGGDGVINAPTLDDDYYQLTSAIDVEWFSQQVAKGGDANLQIKGKLMNDIDFLGIENLHSPIGPDTGKKFNGTFDGQGFRIKNMIIERPTTDYQGFFGYLRGNIQDTYVKNLIIDSSCSITGKYAVGGIAASGQNNETFIYIQNCVNEANITATGGDAGGILGSSTSNHPKWIIQNCVNTGTITATTEKPYAGGLTGWMGNNNNSRIENFVNTGTITYMDNNLNIYRGTITSTSLLVDVSGTTGATQGIVEGLSSSDLSTGKLTYYLNNQIGSNVFFQNLTGANVDAYPVPISTGHAVVYILAELGCDGNPVPGGTATYSNDDSGATIPNHTLGSNGFCTVCGRNPVTSLSQDGDGYLLVGNAADLEFLSSVVNSAGGSVKKVKLTADIDLDGITHTPIGVDDGNKFCGEFDGQGYRILNMKSFSQDVRVGLFGGLRGAENTTIKNVIIDKSSKITGDRQMGAIAGACQTAISPLYLINCINEADVEGTGWNIAGMIGECLTDNLVINITNCGNSGSIKAGDANSCAIFGWARPGNVTVTNFWNTGKIIKGTNDHLERDGHSEGQAVAFNFYNANQSVMDAGNFVLDNCYDASASASRSQGTILDASAATSGELTYKLGGDWCQTIGTDTHPVLDSSKPNVYEISVSDAGYASFVPTVNIASLPTGVTAYVGQINGSSLHLEAVTALPADNAFVVNAAEGNYYYNNTSETITLSETNDLQVATSAFNPTTENTIYCLAKKNGNVGFYPVATTVTIPARKVYLEITSGTSPVKGFFGFDEDDATGISLMEDGRSQMEDGAIYNIAGQRISKMQKGINIVNGKKVLK